MLKIGQISDIHIGEDESLVQDIDVRKNFLDALNSDSMQELDLLVLSGDLANEDAEPGAYKFIADQIKSVSCPVCIIPGNHDNIDVMTQYFDLPVKNGKCYYRFDLQGRSIFFLDSACGEVSRDQLDWLETEIPKVKNEVLLFMLRTFSVPLLISFVIAVPVSWYIMHDWLTNFSYRIALSPWIFAAAGFTCFIISLLSVIVQSWRAASENPVVNIKTE